jgi:hypothetical protein
MRWHRPYQDIGRVLIYAAQSVLLIFVIWAVVTNVGPGPLGTWLDVALGVAGAGYLLLVSRQGIYVSAHGVRVRTLFRSTHVEWSRIRALDDHATGHRTDGVIGFRMADGTILETPVQRWGSVSDYSAPILTRRQYIRLRARLTALIAGGGRPPGAHSRDWRPRLAHRQRNP